MGQRVKAQVLGALNSDKGPSQTYPGLWTCRTMEADPSPQIPAAIPKPLGHQVLVTLIDYGQGYLYGLAISAKHSYYPRRSPVMTLTEGRAY
jgi:hypothetical protein